MDTNKLGFFTNRVEVTEDEIRLQIKNIEDEKLEVCMGFHVDPFSGEVTSNPIRHYIHADSQPWFEDSISWGEWYEKAGVGVTRDH